MEQTEVQFDDLGLSPGSLGNLKAIGFRTPSPIQAAFIPVAISGMDAIGQARTGTGKTAAFVLPILEKLDLTAAHPQALVLTPTRELSQQVADEAHRLSGHQSRLHAVCCVGGKAMRQQIAALQKGAHLVIGTPGRVIDLMTRKILQLGELKIIVLDEADRMLDIGFRPDIERVLKQCPSSRQTLLLSATLPPPVERLARKYMRNPVMVDLSVQGGVAGESIDQYYVPVDHDRKFRTLVQILAQERPSQALVFTRTKRNVEHVYTGFHGKLPSIGYLHGDLAQSVRDRVMKKFREGKIRLLIATDVMGRGIDVSGISHIINYDIPEDCDDYVHRIGRTGRLSSSEVIGKALTFVAGDEGHMLTNIENRINRILDRYEVHGVETHRPRPKPKQLSEQHSDSPYNPQATTHNEDDWHVM